MLIFKIFLFTAALFFSLLFLANMDLTGSNSNAAKFASDDEGQAVTVRSRSGSPELETGYTKTLERFKVGLSEMTQTTEHTSLDSQLAGNEWMNLYRCSDSEDEDPPDGESRIYRDGFEHSSDEALNEGAVAAKSKYQAWLIDSDVSDLEILSSDNDQDKAEKHSVKGRKSMREQLRKAAKLPSNVKSSKVGKVQELD
jgi:hypothetical protein